MQAGQGQRRGPEVDQSRAGDDGHVTGGGLRGGEITPPEDLARLFALVREPRWALRKTVHENSKVVVAAVLRVGMVRASLDLTRRGMHVANVRRAEPSQVEAYRSVRVHVRPFCCIRVQSLRLRCECPLFGAAHVPVLKNQ